MGATRELNSGCSKRAWQWVQQEGLAVAAARGLAMGAARGIGSVCRRRAWQWV